MTTTAFYVYEHVRKDTGAVFYVGKGCGDRCFIKSNRNRHWHNVVNKNNGKFNVCFVAADLDEELAFLVEHERINQLRRLGACLVNKTDGGEGSLGLRFSHSDAVKQYLRKINIGRKHTPEAIAKMSGENNPSKRLDVRKKMSDALKGRVISEEQRIKLSAATKGRPKSEQTKQKMRIAATKRTDQHKQKIAEANKNITPQRRKKLSDALKGRVFSDEHIEKLKISAKNRPVVTCPYCNKKGSRNIMMRHHFDNCKLKGVHMVDKPQTVVIDGKDYRVDDLSDDAKIFISHVADIDAQIAALKFQLDQKSVTRDAFFALLKQALEEKPEEVVAEQAAV